MPAYEASILIRLNASYFWFSHSRVKVPQQPHGHKYESILISKLRLFLQPNPFLFLDVTDLGEGLCKKYTKHTENTIPTYTLSKVSHPCILQSTRSANSF